MMSTAAPDTEQPLLPGHAWFEIVKRSSGDSFAAAFTKDVMLDASVLAAPITGVAGVRRFFEATRGMYDRIAFTGETGEGARTCLEWEGTFEGRDIAGVTILTRNTADAITSIRLYHRPYHQVVAFSAELARRSA
jgi:hypothetical protein